MDQSMQKIHLDYKAIQENFIPQSKQLQKLIEQCEQLMRDQGEWDTEFMGKMSDLDNKLEHQTTTIVQHMKNINVNIEHQLASQLSLPERNLLEAIREMLLHRPPETPPATKALKYNFKEFTIAELDIDWGETIGEGAGGEVFRGKLKLWSSVDNEIAFKKLALPPIKTKLSNQGAASATRSFDSSNSSSYAKLALPIIGSSGSSNSSSSANNLSQRPTRANFVTSAKDLLQREARILWSLNGHPNCVRLHGICLEPAGLVFQYCNRDTLQSLLYQEVPGDDFKIKYVPEKILEDQDKLSCVYQLLAGLYFLHSKGFVHRDVKSPNCLAHNCGTENAPIWNFKWTDFGSARKIADFISTSSFSIPVTGLKQSGGSVRWMAPERRDFFITPEQRERIEKQTSVDIYGLGCVIGEIFLQKPPFANFPVTEVRDLGSKVLPFSDNDLSKLNPSLANLIRQCCASDPSQRISMEKIIYVEWPKVCVDQGTPVVITSTPVMSSGTDLSVNIRSLPPIREAHRSKIVTVEAIINDMKHHVNVSDVQDYACRALVDFCMNNDASNIKIVAAGGIEAIIDGMKHHVNVSDVQQYACRALVSLCSNNNPNDSKIVAAGGIEAIIAGMKHHVNVSDVQHYACLVLVGLSSHNDANDSKIVAAGGVEAIIDGMKHHVNVSDVQEYAYRALVSLIM